MPRFKELDKYPDEFFKILSLVAKQGEKVLELGDWKSVLGMRAQLYGFFQALKRTKEKYDKLLLVNRKEAEKLEQQFELILFWGIANESIISTYQETNSLKIYNKNDHWAAKWLRDNLDLEDHDAPFDIRIKRMQGEQGSLQRKIDVETKVIREVPTHEELEAENRTHQEEQAKALGNSTIDQTEQTYTEVQDILQSPLVEPPRPRFPRMNQVLRGEKQTERLKVLQEGFLKRKEKEE